jgi:hypothetical protein
MIASRIGRMMVCLLVISGAVMMPALGQSAKDRLGVPGPISFQGTKFALVWSASPAAGYIKQEYLPTGQKLERYDQMFMIESQSAATPDGAAAAQIAMLKTRKQSDPTVNYDIIRNNATGDIILDFILSDPRAGIVEWNAYRYVRLGKSGGVALYAISRRAYGDKARDFLAALKQNRPPAIQALAVFDAPPLRPNP